MRRARPRSGPRTESRNRVAVATWRAPTQGLVYARLEVDVSDAEGWWTARRLSPVHVVGAALGRALVACPDANARVVAGRVRQRPSADVSFAVNSNRGGHLRAVCVRDADTKAPDEIATELFKGTRGIAAGADPQFERAIRLADRLPRLLLRPALWLAGWIAGGLGRRVPLASVEAFPFGSALVSSVGTFGLDNVHAPVLPFARVGLVLVVGTVAERPRVVDGEVVARRTLDLNLTLDHRLLDGAQASLFADVLTGAIERPAEAFGDVAALEAALADLVSA